MEKTDFQRDYVLKLEGVHGDMDRFVSLASMYNDEKLTDAMLALKSALVQRLPVLLGDFHQSVVINIVDGENGRVDLVLNGKHRDVYIKVTMNGDHRRPVPTATLLYGDRNASSVDMFDFDPMWFANCVANPAKLAVLMYSDAITKLLETCWTEQASAETRVNELAKQVANQRQILQAQLAAKAKAEAEAASEQPAEQVDAQPQQTPVAKKQATRRGRPAKSKK